MKKLFLFATAFVLAAAAFAQDGTPLSAQKVAPRAAALQGFAPKGWKIEKQISGDLNRDKKPDVALVLVENLPVLDKENIPTPRQRALVVALRQGKVWQRVGFSGFILPGTRDGGAFYGVVETPVNVSIAKGVLNINQDSGSREVTETTHRFRYDAASHRMLLIGSEVIEHDRATGDWSSTSTNYLTGVQNIVGGKGTSQHETHRTARVSKKPRALESMTIDQRYAE